MEVKLCKDCKHRLRINGHPHCDRDIVSEKNLVDGGVTKTGHKDCYLERYPDPWSGYYEFFCGPEAKYFKPRE